MKYIKLFEDFSDKLFEHDIDISKYNDLEMLHQTHRGYVYDYGDNKILKITKDKIEYDNALIFIENPSKYFVNYYTGKSIGGGFYELIMDKLEELNDDEWEMVDMIQNSLGNQDYMLDDNKRFTFLQELKQNPEWYEDFATFKQMMNMINLLKRMYIDAKQRGIELYDLRAINMGKTKEGDIVHFDIGAG